jgi:hypothetical protein
MVAAVPGTSNPASLRTGDRHAVPGVAQVAQLDAAADVDAQLGRPPLQDRLGGGLRNGLGRLVGAVEDAEVDGDAAEVALVAGVHGAEPRQQAPLVEDLHGAGGEPEPPRLAGGAFEAFDDDHVHPGQPQLGSGHEPRGASAGDDD